MDSRALENERLAAECYLLGPRTDYTTTYMRVANLQYIIDMQPEIIRPATVSALCSVLEGPEHRHRRQAFFLFKKAAEALAAVVERTHSRQTAALACRALADVLAAHTGPPLRAAAEAMGALPLSIRAPDPAFFQVDAPPVHRVTNLASLTGGPSAGMQGKWLGRSLLLSASPESERLLVLKFARAGQSASDLASEYRWMQYLAGPGFSAAGRLDLPVPLQPENPLVYRLDSAGLVIPRSLKLHSARLAIGFAANRTYFCYPNHPVDGKMIEKAQCRRILAKNARLLARLAANGIIHTAPVPLFHNRVQRHRRQDQGLYEWRRGGRLDQWLSSCRYPNIGKGGIRDLEHLIAFTGPPRSLYDYIGAQVLSLVLVAGSYFRNRDEDSIGLDSRGRPVDARSLFDREWLKNMLKEIFTGYYEGFTGCAFADALPFCPEDLCRRLVEEMGVDRHMEEILRVPDQESMSPPEFEAFLLQRGLPRDRLGALKKGEQEIRILTGPHLGGFNQRISVPELTEYAAIAAGRCIMDAFRRQRFPEGVDADKLQAMA
jgi:hypothetical protein